jgi:formylglycine-generating enzyme required for sulfatase activity
MSNPDFGSPEFADFTDVLKQVKLNLCAKDLMDILWLANQTGEIPPIAPDPNQDDNNDVEVVWGEDLPLSELPPPDRVAVTQRDSSPAAAPQTRQSPSGGIAVSAPTAPTLRTRLELGRALRPLMRKVAALNREYLDEEATATQIAEQDVWLPVMRPAAERWLELALVVEDSASTPIWRSLIHELRLLTERQGAFRTVQSWRLTASEAGQPQLFSGNHAPRPGQRSRSPKELIDPAGRRLILIVSDCTSALWRQRPLYHWLQLWETHAPTTVMQLLPQRLWERSALGEGTPVWVRSLTPGTVTAHWKVEEPLDFLAETSGNGQSPATLTVPVVTVEPNSIKPWARVLVGAGEARAAAVQFDWDDIPLPPVNTAAETEPIALVRRFRGGASIMAQRLAGMMAAVPVSPEITDLLRQTLLPEARQVHVAEVFMSGLIRMTRTERPQGGHSQVYDFVSEEVRDLLTDAVDVPTTEKVLDTVSAYLSERWGLGTRTFEALLTPDLELSEEAEGQVLPFAYLARRTLQRMGAEYAELVELLGQPVRTPTVTATDQPVDNTFPPLKTFEFEVAKFVPAAAAWPELRTKEFEVVTVQVGAGELERPELERRLIEVIGQQVATRLNEPFLDATQVSLADITFVIGQTSQELSDEDTILDILQRPDVDRRLLILGEPGTGKTATLLRLTQALLGQATENPETPIPILLGLRSWSGRDAKLSDWLLEQLRTRYNLPAETGGEWLAERRLLPLLDGLDELPTPIRGELIQAINRWLREFDPPGMVVSSRLAAYERLERQLALNGIVTLSSSALDLFEYETATIQRREQRTLFGLRPNRTRWQIEKRRGQGRQLAERLGDGLQLEMKWIPSGSFMMGSPADEPERTSAEGPQHEVKVSSFLLGRDPVTQNQWRFVAGLPQVELELNAEPSWFKGDDLPVEQVSWNEAQEFCRRLSVYAEHEYRLPSEAEWEYACRADTQTPFHFGEMITPDLANYNGRFAYNNGPKGQNRRKITAVGSFPANQWGLSDMHGNIYEWCQDVWHDNYEGAPTDGSAWTEGSNQESRVVRGGSWLDLPRFCRSACRSYFSPGFRSYDLGFRVCCAAPGLS